MSRSSIESDAVVARKGTTIIVQDEPVNSQPFVSKPAPVYNSTVAGYYDNTPVNVKPNVNLPQPMVGGEILWDKLTESQKLAFNAWRVALGSAVVAYGVVTVAPAALSFLKGLSVPSAVKALNDLKSGAITGAYDTQGDFITASGPSGGFTASGSLRQLVEDFMASNKRPAGMSGVGWDKLIQRALLYGLVREGIYQVANVVSRYFPSAEDQQRMTNAQLDEIIKNNTITLQNMDIAKQSAKTGYSPVANLQEDAIGRSVVNAKPVYDSSGRLQGYVNTTNYVYSGGTQNRTVYEYTGGTKNLTEYKYSGGTTNRNINENKYSGGVRYDYYYHNDPSMSEYEKQSLRNYEENLALDREYKEWIMSGAGEKTMYAPQRGEYVEDYGSGDDYGAMLGYFSLGEDGGLNGYADQQELNGGLY